MKSLMKKSLCSAFAVAAVAIAATIGIAGAQPVAPAQEETPATVEFPVNESLPQDSVARLGYTESEDDDQAQQADDAILTSEDGNRYFAQQLMMSVDSATTQQELEDSLEAQGVQVESLSLISNNLLDGQTTLLVEYSSSQDPQDLCETLADAGIAANAEPNGVMEVYDEDNAAEGVAANDEIALDEAADNNEALDAAATGSEDQDPQTATSSTEFETQATVNDSYASFQWNLTSTKAYSAWDTIKCNGTVTVAVIDSGADYDHSDLADNLSTTYAKNFLTGKTGKTAIDDDYGHGTHVSGIIAATTNNAMGCAGISYNAKVLPLKAMDANGNGSFANVISAIDYAINLKTNGYVPSLRVINMSLGTTGYSSYLQDAVTRAYNAGILVVASAGNNASSTPCYPAACKNVISVSALEDDGSTTGTFCSSWSNYGSTIDLAAPGANILSTTPNNCCSWKSGTSMAAPAVSAVAALVYARNTSATPSYVESVLETTATDLGSTGKDNYYGYGAVNAAAAVKAAGSAVSASKCTVSGISDQTYSASGVRPTPSVYCGSTLLTKGTDYDLSYSNNTEVGTGYVTVNFKNRYTGSITRSFKINAAKVTPPTTSNFTYDGKSHTGLSATSSNYYSVSGTTSATEAGTYTATATLKDKTNYVWSTTGTSNNLTLTWKISAAASNTTKGQFADVQDPDAWYYRAVYEANDHGFLTGYDNGLFGPSDTLTRGQAAVILYRYYGGSASKYNRTGMPDVEDGAYYTAAANWAVANGVINGVDGGARFAPNDPLTREQLCTIIYNAAKKFGSDGENVFGWAYYYTAADYDKVSSWAQSAVAWSLGNNVIKGKEVSGESARYIAPQDTVTRAEMAAIIMNVYNGGVLKTSSVEESDQAVSVNNQQAQATSDDARLKAADQAELAADGNDMAGEGSGSTESAEVANEDVSQATTSPAEATDAGASDAPAETGRLIER